MDGMMEPEIEFPRLSVTLTNFQHGQGIFNATRMLVTMQEHSSRKNAADGTPLDRPMVRWEVTRRLAGSPKVEVTFAALVVAQAAHSIEEYVGRLWESFPPAAFLTGLISPDRELGFIIINVGLVAFGLWCAIWPVRRAWQSAGSLVWFWIVIETINGVGHPTWSLLQGGYTPGVITAPILLVLALYLATLLSRS